MEHDQWLEFHSLVQAKLFSLGLEILAQWSWNLSCMHSKHQNYWNMGKRVKARARPLGKNQSCQSSPSSEQTSMQYDLLCVLTPPTQHQALFQVSSQVCAFSSQPSIQALALCPLTHVKLPITISTLWLDNFSLAGKLMTCNCEFAALEEGEDNPASVMVICKSRVAFMFFSAAAASWANFSACPTWAFKLSFAFLAASNFSFRSAAFCKAVETLASICSAYFSASRNAARASCNFLSMLLLLLAWPGGLRVRSWSMPSSSSLWRKWLEGKKFLNGVLVTV